LIVDLDKFDVAGEGVGLFLIELGAPQEGRCPELFGEGGGDCEILKIAQGDEVRIGIGTGGSDEAGGFGGETHLAQVGEVDHPVFDRFEMRNLLIEGGGGLLGAGAAVLDVEHGDTVFAAGKGGGDEAVEASGVEDDGEGLWHDFAPNC